jgi:hypothetical protein
MEDIGVDGRVILTGIFKKQYSGRISQAGQKAGCVNTVMKSGFNKMRELSWLDSLEYQKGHYLVDVVCYYLIGFNATLLFRCFKSFNLLTPELNPSVQRCLTRFLLGIFLPQPCISLIYA